MKITVHSTEYTTERDRGGWSLHSPNVAHRKKDSKNGKAGEEYVEITTTYYGNFRQVCQAILDREIGKCPDLEAVRDLLLAFPETIQDAAKQIQAKS
jgi:hypothetical protein